MEGYKNRSDLEGLLRSEEGKRKGDLARRAPWQARGGGSLRAFRRA